MNMLNSSLQEKDYQPHKKMFKHCHNNSRHHEMVEKISEMMKMMSLNSGQLSSSSPPSRPPRHPSRPACPPSRPRCRGGKPGAAPEAGGRGGEMLQDRAGQGVTPLPFRPYSALSPPGKPRQSGQPVPTPPLSRRPPVGPDTYIEDALSLLKKEPKYKILIKLGIEFGVPGFLSPVNQKRKGNIWFDKKRLRNHWNVNEANVIAVAREGFEKILKILKISSQDLIRMNLQPLKRKRLSTKKTFLPNHHLHNLNKKLGSLTKKEIFKARMANLMNEELDLKAYETKNLPLNHTCRMFNVLTADCQKIRKEAKKHDDYTKVERKDYQEWTCNNCNYSIQIQKTLSNSEKASLHQKFVKHLSVYNFCTRIKLGCNTCKTCQTYSKEDQETIKKVKKVIVELNNMDDSIYEACHEAMLMATLKEEFAINVKNLDQDIRNRFPDAKIPRLNKPDLLLILEQVSKEKIDSDSSLEAFIKNLFWKRKLHKNRMNFFDIKRRKEIDRQGHDLLKFKSMEEWKDWKLWNYQKYCDDIEYAIAQRQKLHKKFFKDELSMETKLKNEIKILKTTINDWRKAKLMYNQRFGPKGNKVVPHGSFISVQSKLWEMIQETNRLKPERNVKSQSVGLHLFGPFLLDPPLPGQPPPRGNQARSLILGTPHYDLEKLHKHGIKEISFFTTRTEKSLQQEALEKKIDKKRRLEYKNKAKFVTPSEAKEIRKLQCLVSQLLEKYKKEKVKLTKFVEDFKSSIDWDFPSKDRKTLFSAFAKEKAEHTKILNTTKKKLQELRMKISKIQSPQLPNIQETSNERCIKWTTTINHAIQDNPVILLSNVKEGPQKIEEIETMPDVQSPGKASVKSQNSATFMQVPQKRKYIKQTVNLNGPDLDEWEPKKLYFAHYRILSFVSLYEYF